MPARTSPAARFTSTGNAGRVARRSRGLRALGLGLGAIMVGVVFSELRVAVFAWVLLALYAIAWPHLSALALRHHSDPVELDKLLFVGDVAMGGVWIALMQFNLLPSAVLVAMVTMTLMAIGGYRMLLRGMLALSLACAVTALANGFVFSPETRTPELLASLPLLIFFPTSLGAVTYGLARHMRLQNRELYRMGSVDKLSGLLNRTHWEDAVNAALSRHLCEPAVMLLIDVDRFKGVNDAHGHTVGDQVIRQVGAIIRQNLREGDLAGRYGGDEFGVVLCGVDLADGAKVAERIRADVERVLFERAPGLRCTLSIGVARSPASGARTVGEWVKDADAALYSAKIAGRNRLMMAA
ncbi:MAG: diguanylate cyclase [Xanthomonadaceae bacterium]|nr:diguanylate cyclase [Xanthomonadaceae bacterium]